MTEQAKPIIRPASQMAPRSEGGTSAPTAVPGTGRRTFLDAVSNLTTGQRVTGLFGLGAAGLGLAACGAMPSSDARPFSGADSGADCLPAATAPATLTSSVEAGVTKSPTATVNTSPSATAGELFDASHLRINVSASCYVPGPTETEVTQPAEVVPYSSAVQQFIEANNIQNPEQRDAALEALARQYFGTQDAYVRDANANNWEVVRGETNSDMITILLHENPVGGNSRIDLSSVASNAFYEGYIQENWLPNVPPSEIGEVFPQAIAGTVEGLVGLEHEGIQPWVDARGLKVHILTKHLTTGELNAAAWQKALDMTAAEAGVGRFADGSQKQPGVLVVNQNTRDPQLCGEDGATS